MGIYHCNKCEKSFTMKRDLYVHQKIHKVYGKIRCPICQSICLHQTDLQLHLKLFHKIGSDQSGETMVQCKECGENILKGAPLRMHMNLHKEIKCKNCGMTFTHRQEFKRHKNLCPNSEKSDNCLETSDNISEHMEKCLINNLECKNCKSNFGNIQDLHAHLKQFVCDVKRSCQGQIDEKSSCSESSVINNHCTPLNKDHIDNTFGSYHGDVGDSQLNVVGAVSDNIQEGSAIDISSTSCHGDIENSQLFVCDLVSKAKQDGSKMDIISNPCHGDINSCHGDVISCHGDINNYHGDINVSKTEIYGLISNEKQNEKEKFGMSICSQGDGRNCRFEESHLVLNEKLQESQSNLKSDFSECKSNNNSSINRKENGILTTTKANVHSLNDIVINNNSSGENLSDSENSCRMQADITQGKDLNVAENGCITQVDKNSHIDFSVTQIDFTIKDDNISDNTEKVPSINKTVQFTQLKSPNSKFKIVVLSPLSNISKIDASKQYNIYPLVSDSGTKNFLQECSRSPIFNEHLIDKAWSGNQSKSCDNIDARYQSLMETNDEIESLDIWKNPSDSLKNGILNFQDGQIVDSTRDTNVSDVCTPQTEKLNPGIVGLPFLITNNNVSMETIPCKCVICGESFQTLSLLYNHCLQTHPKCDICGKQLKHQVKISGEKLTNETASLRRPYRCRVCRELYKLSLSVQSKMQPKTSCSGQQKCHLCERSFKTSKLLDLHSRIHTQFKPHVCRLCGKKFMWKNSLSQHYNLHIGDKPYKCAVCGRLFSGQRGIKLHIRHAHSVNDETSLLYQCEKCGQKFYKLFSLEKHLAKHAKMKEHECSKCGKKFANLFNLKSHIVKTHKDVPYLLQKSGQRSTQTRKNSGSTDEYTNNEKYHHQISSVELQQLPCTNETLSGEGQMTLGQENDSSSVKNVWYQGQSSYNIDVINQGQSASDDFQGQNKNDKQGKHLSSGIDRTEYDYGLYEHEQDQVQEIYEGQSSSDDIGEMNQGQGSLDINEDTVKCVVMETESVNDKDLSHLGEFLDKGSHKSPNEINNQEYNKPNECENQNISDMCQRSKSFNQNENITCEGQSEINKDQIQKICVQGQGHLDGISDRLDETDGNMCQGQVNSMDEGEVINQRNNNFSKLCIDSEIEKYTNIQIISGDTKTEYQNCLQSNINTIQRQKPCKYKKIKTNTVRRDDRVMRVKYHCDSFTLDKLSAEFKDRKNWLYSEIMKTCMDMVNDTVVDKADTVKKPEKGKKRTNNTLCNSEKNYYKSCNFDKKMKKERLLTEDDKNAETPKENKSKINDKNNGDTRLCDDKPDIGVRINDRKYLKDKKDIVKNDTNIQLMTSIKHSNNSGFYGNSAKIQQDHNRVKTHSYIKALSKNSMSGSDCYGKSVRREPDIYKNSITTKPGFVTIVNNNHTTTTTTTATTTLTVKQNNISNNEHSHSTKISEESDNCDNHNFIKLSRKNIYRLSPMTPGGYQPSTMTPGGYQPSTMSAGGYQPSPTTPGGRASSENQKDLTDCRQKNIASFNYNDVTESREESTSSNKNINITKMDSITSSDNRETHVRDNSTSCLTQIGDDRAKSVTKLQENRTSVEHNKNSTLVREDVSMNDKYKQATGMKGDNSSIDGDKILSAKKDDIDKIKFSGKDFPEAPTTLSKGDENKDIPQSNFILHNLGRLYPRHTATDSFHTRDYIYPVGYRASRTFWSMRQRDKLCRYICSIVDKNGHPQFVVEAIETGLSDVVFRSSSIKNVFSHVKEMVDMRRSCHSNRLLVRAFPDISSGEEFFGLSIPVICKALEDLPESDQLYNYIHKYRQVVTTELPLMVYPHGCARTEVNKTESQIKKLCKLKSRNMSLSSCHLSSSSLEHGLLSSPLKSKKTPSTTPGFRDRNYRYLYNLFKCQYLELRHGWKNTTNVDRSNIQGLGLFAARDIDKDSLVIEYVGELIRNSVADIREKKYRTENRGVYMFRLNEDQVIDATRQGGPARYINHSCNPNCTAEIFELDHKSRIIIITNSYVRKGEELTYDYRFDIEEDEQKIPCHCGSSHCRKFMN